MIEEVRRQFKSIPGLMEGKAEADYTKCVDISTAAAIREMVVPRSDGCRRAGCRSASTTRKRWAVCSPASPHRA